MRWASLAAAIPAAMLLSTETTALRLIEIDPGHGHAAALHAHVLPGFSDEAHIYAPLGTDLTAHMNRILQFNERATDPTHWNLKVYAGPDFLRPETCRRYLHLLPNFKKPSTKLFPKFMTQAMLCANPMTI